MKGEINLNKQDIVKLYLAIKEGKNRGNIKFRYGLLKNNYVINSEITTLQEIENEMNKIIEPFDKEREVLIKKIGIFNISTNSYSIPTQDIEKVKQFTKEFSPIQLKYKNLIVKRNTKYKEYSEMLLEEFPETLKFIPIKIEDCPLDLKTESLEIFMQFNIIK